jgi:hypothetical protein
MLMLAVDQAFVHRATKQQKVCTTQSAHIDKRPNRYHGNEGLFWRPSVSALNHAGCLCTTSGAPLLTLINTCVLLLPFRLAEDQTMLTEQLKEL